MAVRLIRKSWWVDFRVDHTRYRKRSPENSRAGAQAYEAALRQRLARGEDILGKRERVAVQTFAEFSTTWFEEYVLPNNKPGEQHCKKYAFSASLIPFFGSMPIALIGARDIERYKASLIRSGVSRKTVNNRLTMLRKCLHTAFEWLSLPGTPPKIVWLKCPPPRTDYLTPDECELLLRHSDGVIREMILAALRTGMRQGELKGLQWSSIDWLNESIAVRHSFSDYTKSLDSPKNNRVRHIPMDVDVLEVLDARKRDNGFVFLDELGRPFDHYRLSDALAKVCRRAGLRKIGWHPLRHTFASHLAMNGIPLNAVQALLGHASIATTMRYAHVAPSTLRAAIKLVNPRTAEAASRGQPVGNKWLERQLQLRQIDDVSVEKPNNYALESSDDLPLAA
jgi:integrase